MCSVLYLGGYVGVLNAVLSLGHEHEVAGLVPAVMKCVVKYWLQGPYSTKLPLLLVDNVQHTVPGWVCRSVERCPVGGTWAWGRGPRTSGHEVRGSRCGRGSLVSGCDRSSPWCRWTCRVDPSPTASPPCQPSTFTATHHEGPHGLMQGC